MKKFLACSLLSVSTLAFSAPAAKDPLNSFPKAAQGQIRWVIELPKQRNEQFLQLEIIPGKKMDVDCNNHFLAGELKEENLEGWGYNFYTFISNGNVGSTVMGCPNNSKRTAFVNAPSKLIGYNSKLPVVVYAPAGYTIEYRIWSARSQTRSAQPK